MHDMQRNKIVQFVNADSGSSRIGTSISTHAFRRVQEDDPVTHLRPLKVRSLTSLTRRRVSEVEVSIYTSPQTRRRMRLARSLRDTLCDTEDEAEGTYYAMY